MPIQWQVETLRLTVFLVSFQMSTQEWWSELVGREPDNVSQNNKTNTKTYQGILNDTEIQLTLSVQPQRVDWFFSLYTDQENPPNGLPILGDYKEQGKIFLDLLKPWISREDLDIRRIAFGAVLLDPVSSKKEGYESLDSLLPPVKVDPEESRDFYYTINRPRTIQFDDNKIEVNRLSKWAFLQLRSVQFGAGQNSPIVDLPGQPCATRLELDINTSEDYTEYFPKDSKVKIFEKLYELANEIATEGDKP